MRVNLIKTFLLESKVIRNGIKIKIIITFKTKKFRIRYINL